MIRLSLSAGLAFAGVALIATPVSAAQAACTANIHFAVAVHGGEISERVDNPGRLEAMHTALAAARAELGRGGSSLDVVEAIVRSFEDSGLFNAGRGAIANERGIVETDAAIMAGDGMRSGAVASLLHIKNPVHAARLVMENGRHALMVGDRGEAFAKRLGAESVPDSYFIKAVAAKPASPEHGTVGAAALDRCGHIAAATSTGGYDAKVPGRVGDTPIVGAGTYADDRVGLSASGHGEYFIRLSVAKDVADRVRYAHQPLASAMRADIHSRLAAFKDADGGLIGVDRDGNVAMDWNRLGLYRGYATDAEAPVVADYAGPKQSRPRR
ncbi:MAG TPA: isoaspartyl peptidase/L-asparaginase [Rhizomicrobium sp.]|nr:isoaspartyl peptidase/L-asparaginase [Rhizomicrobium sp.]